ncbi:MAG: type II toxin-antitoxin system VapC family toxin [Candidatus Eremiobacteraeota bacterium]|nr:type II toxin-antitoxin system VapC family toxin [Candidatus Eremiobacteraeota bacterium]
MEVSRVLIDTPAYSAFLRGSKAIKTALQHAQEINVSPIVVGELLAGFMKGRKMKENRERLAEFLLSPRVRIIPLDEETSERYAVLHSFLYSAGKPIPTHDLWIAAQAMQHGLKILTTDRHFDAVPHVLKEIFPP